MSDLATAPVVARPSSGGMLDVAAQREIAQVQAAILMARKFPRDPATALDRVVMACARPELAEAALYTYARGGTDITGPSIRMAEALAQNWGNIEFGIRELEQRGNESTVEAFAMDLETNTRQVKVFQVPHVRYTRKDGRTALEDPRDVYEQVANQGARRLRACILGIIPGDVIDAAVRQVEVTLKTKAEATPERIKDVLDKFAGLGVTRSMIERRIQRRVEALTPALIVNLGKVYNSLKDGMSGVADWFDHDTTPDGGSGGDAPAPATRTESVKEALKGLQVPAVHAAGPAAHPDTPSAPADAGRDAAAGAPDGAAVAGSAEEPRKVETAELLEAKAERDRKAALAQRIVDAAKSGGAFTKARKIWLPAKVAESLGLFEGEYGAMNLVELGHGEAVATWLESTPDGDAA